MNIRNLAIIVAVLGGILFYRYLKQTEPRPTVVVKRSSIKEIIAAKGKVLASKESKVAAKMAGKIMRVYVSDGDTVYSGQTLAKIDDSELQAQLKQAYAAVNVEKSRYNDIDSGSREQEIASAKFELNQAQATLDNSLTDLERVKNLFNEGAIPKVEVDAKELAVKINQDRVKQVQEKISLLQEGAKKETKQISKAAINQAQTQINYIKSLLANTIITAPFSGVITYKRIEVGEVVNPAIPAFTLADISTLKVVVEIDETDIGKVHLGQKMIITADAFPDKIFNAKITKIGNELGKKKIKSDDPLEMADTTVLEVEAILDSSADKYLKMGLNIDTQIDVATRQNCLVLPQSAINEDKGIFKVMFKQGRKYIPREVEIGLKTSGTYEILSGLKEGDEVAKDFEK